MKRFTSIYSKKLQEIATGLTYFLVATWWSGNNKSKMTLLAEKKDYLKISKVILDLNQT